MVEDYHFPALQNTTLPRVLMPLYRTAESRGGPTISAFQAAIEARLNPIDSVSPKSRAVHPVAQSTIELVRDFAWLADPISADWLDPEERGRWFDYGAEDLYGLGVDGMFRTPYWRERTTDRSDNQTSVLGGDLDAGRFGGQLRILS